MWENVVEMIAVVGNHAKCNAFIFFFSIFLLAFYIQMLFRMFSMYVLCANDCHEFPAIFLILLYHNRISKYHPNRIIVLDIFFIVVFVYATAVVAALCV